MKKHYFYWEPVLCDFENRPEKIVRIDTEGLMASGYVSLNSLRSSIFPAVQRHPNLVYFGSKKSIYIAKKEFFEDFIGGLDASGEWFWEHRNGYDIGTEHDPEYEKWLDM